MNPRIIKAVLLFVAEFVVWLLAGVVIGAIKGDWKSILTNGNFYILAGVFSAMSAYFDYQKGGQKDDKKDDNK